MPVPTAVYTNQTGFSRFASLDCARVLQEYPVLWREHGVAPDGIYTGFMSTGEQLAAAQAMIDTFRPPLVLIDPVMGDDGKPYPGFNDQLCAAIAQFARQAHMITPNVTELFLLAGHENLATVNYEEFLRAPPKEQERTLRGICEALPQKRIVVTGWRRGIFVINAAWDNGAFQMYASPAIAGSWSGTGDLFASALCGGLLRGESLERSMQRTVCFLQGAVGEAARRNVPKTHGIPFEFHLKELLN